MKRTTRKQPTHSGEQPVTVGRARLSTARGGLDLAVDVAGAPAPDVPLQHNELLVTR
jgi:hypothetical protein